MINPSKLSNILLNNKKGKREGKMELKNMLVESITVLKLLF